MCGEENRLFSFASFNFFLGGASIYSQWKQRKQSFLGDNVISNVPSEHSFAFKKW